MGMYRSVRRVCLGRSRYRARSHCHRMKPKVSCSSASPQGTLNAIVSKQHRIPIVAKDGMDSDLSSHDSVLPAKWRSSLVHVYRFDVSASCQVVVCACDPESHAKARSFTITGLGNSVTTILYSTSIQQAVYGKWHSSWSVTHH